MPTSFREPSDFLLAGLKLSTETKALNKVSQGYHVRSDVRRKTQLHKTRFITTMTFNLTEYRRLNFIYSVTKISPFMLSVVIF